MKNFIRICVKLLREGAIIPKKAYEGDLCYDIFAPEELFLPPNTIVPVPTGIAIEPEDGYGVIIRDKSSVAVRKVTIHGGEIDNTYRGEIKILMFNHNDVPATFSAGQKIAQLRVIRSSDIVFQEVEALSDTKRGDGGFGSSGKF